MHKAITPALICLATLLITEVYLRLSLPVSDRPFILPPNALAIYRPTPAGVPGTQPGEHRFITNSLGIRSGPPPTDSRRVIYVMGSSTSIDVWLDQPDAWPQRLETILNNDKDTRQKVWVANLSKWGKLTDQDITYFDDVIPYMPKPDLVIIAGGAADMQRTIKSHYPEKISAERAKGLAYFYIPPGGNFLTNSGFYRLYRRFRTALSNLDTGTALGGDGDSMLALRACRQKVSDEDLVNELPNIDQGLALYRTNLESLIGRSRRLGATTALLTAPSLWRARMRPEEKALLVSGGVGDDSAPCAGRRFYSPEALEKALRAINDVARSICAAKTDVFCVDLERNIPKEHLYFYDDLHFTEKGADLAAQAVAAAIKNHDRRSLQSGSNAQAR